MGEVREAVSPRSESVEALARALGTLETTYDERFLDTDPLRYVHRYAKLEDREIAGLFSALLAFGNVKAIFRSLDVLFGTVLTPTPLDAILATPASCSHALAKFRHRWISGDDIHAVMVALQNVYQNEGSLGRLFANSLEDRKTGVAGALNQFFAEILRRTRRPKGKEGRGLRFLLASPQGGSPCKRANLFLRWMVRGTRPDLGLWSRPLPKDLFLPMDTHVSRLAFNLGLIRGKSRGWKMVGEATAALRRLDPEDPIRFDFALARLGILEECFHRFEASKCPRCPLREVCRIRKRHRSS